MIQFSSHSGIYTLTSLLELPIGIDTAWDFFSSPENLEKITPDKMGFKITSGKPEKMYAGQIISYTVGVFPGIRSNWVTEITSVREKRFFIDEQRFGPYRMWHHEHHFEEVNNKTVMMDKISYKLPFGFLGKLAHKIFVKKQLQSIFVFREKVLTDFFI